MIKALLVGAALLGLGSTAQAQDWNALSAKSQLIQREAAFLKSKRAISVYASDKPYCPSSYWWSSRQYANGEAQRKFKKLITSQMQNAGFPASTISHCVQNSSFLLESGLLQKHPKNLRYDSYVQPAIMLVRTKSTGEIASIPVLIETNTWRGQKSQKMFDQNFKEICRSRGKLKDFRTTCRSYGEMKGNVRTASNQRATYVLQNAKYQTTISLRRTKKYALSKFDTHF